MLLGIEFIEIFQNRKKYKKRFNINMNILKKELKCGNSKMRKLFFYV